MGSFKKLWSVLLVLVMFAAVPVMISGCGDENEQDQAEKKIEEAKKKADDLLNN